LSKVDLKELILDPLWRYNNLYYIKDKWGKLRILRMNYAQWYVEKISSHSRKIILKSRQQGISTYYLMRNLDYCLTTPGIEVGIQSYGLDETAKLQNRVKIMLDHLDPLFYKIFGVEIIKSNAKEIVFSNNSSLKIGNFRGDTLQALHISEYAKISKRYPEKAKEIKTGALQAIAKGNPISIESTAEGQEGEFYDLWSVSVRKLINDSISSLDFFPIFLSWLIDPDCTLDDPKAKITPEALEYERMLKEKLPNVTLTEQQLKWLSAKLDELGEDFNREYPATPELAFKEAVEGTYFKHQYKVMLRDRRIGNYPPNPNYPVDVAYDLGINDEFVMIFSQLIDNEPRIIYEYHNSGYSLEWYIENVLFSLKDRFGWKFRYHYLPHDVKVRELSTGLTRLQTFQRYGIYKTIIVPKLPFIDTIQAARSLLVNSRIHEPNCPNLIKAIQNYRKRYDEKLGTFVDTGTPDVHDIHSHYAAALRYLALGYGYHSISRKPQIKSAIIEEKDLPFATL